MEQPVGAAWWCFFEEDDPGYVFLDDATPEVSVAVHREWRRRGIGEALLQALIERARVERVPALSLSVESDNPAVRLYERLGFEVVGTKRGALTMLVRTGIQS